VNGGDEELHEENNSACARNNGSGYAFAGTIEADGYDGRLVIRVPVICSAR
jgi:hypothetical protein